MLGNKGKKGKPTASDLSLPNTSSKLKSDTVDGLTFLWVHPVGKKGMRYKSSESIDEYVGEPQHKWNNHVANAYYQGLIEQQQQNYEIHNQEDDPDTDGSSTATTDEADHGEEMYLQNFDSQKNMEWGTDHGWNYHVEQDASTNTASPKDHGKRRFRRHPRDLRDIREELQEEQTASAENSV